jgi:hypothetical protein
MEYTLPKSSRLRRPSPIRRVGSALVVAAAVVLSVSAQAAAAPSQPRQPVKGPGGSQTVFGGVRAVTGGRGYNAWEILEPTHPTPPSAPLVVVMHGYYEFSGYDGNGALARHTALKGNVVIYPRWQTGIATPCPGPYDIEPCIRSAVTAIHDAIAYLQADPHRVHPLLDQTSYFGFSFGGIITADMTSRWRALHLPKPRAIFLDDPHDGGLTGNTEPALYPSLGGIPSTTRFVCHAGADGVISMTNAAGQSLANASCNAVFPKIAQIPVANKSIVLTSDDSHGRPALLAIHGVCAGPGAPDTTTRTGQFPVDAFDWGFCWRSFDALRACVLYGTDCRYALGNTPQNRYIGTWSDGVPIVALKIRSRAPIRPLPTPNRQPAPPPSAATSPPHARFTGVQATYSHERRVELHGNASGANGVVFVEVAVVRHTFHGCSQLNADGRFTALRLCSQPTSLMFAAGTNRWSLKLPPRLRSGAYEAFVRAVDSFGQSRHAAAGARFTVI